MGGARWDTVWFSTVREGGAWGALHAILVKGQERHDRHTRLRTGPFQCLAVTTPTTYSLKPTAPATTPPHTPRTALYLLLFNRYDSDTGWAMSY